MGLIADSVTIIYRYYKGFFFHMNKFHTSDLRDKISFFEIFKKWKFVFIGNLDIFPLISPCDIVSINLWSHHVILSVSTFDLTMWYCQYQPLISPSDIVSINLWSHQVILSVSTFDLTMWYCQYQPLISPCDIVSINRLLWYWKCYVKYIIMLLIKTIPSVSQISSYIITSITAHPISLTAILLIMSISTFKSAVTLYFYTESCILKSFILTNYSCDV